MSTDTAFTAWSLAHEAADAADTAHWSAWAVAHDAANLADTPEGVEAAWEPVRGTRAALEAARSEVARLYPA